MSADSPPHPKRPASAPEPTAPDTSKQPDPAEPKEPRDGEGTGSRFGGAGFAMALAGLMMVLAMSTLDSNIVGPALPRIVSDLGGFSHLAWVLTAFLLTATMTTPLYGKLSDMYGRKPLFAVAVGLFLLGSILSGLAQSMQGLIAGRAIQGLGGGGLMTLTQITISDLVPPIRRARYQGLFGAVFTGCSVVGPPLGGFITEALSWRWIFFVNVPVGVVGLVLIWLSIKDGSRATRQSIDYSGIIVVSIATAAALLGLSLGGTVFPWLSVVTIGLFVASGLFFSVLITIERRADNPIIEMALFRNRIFTVAAVVSALVSTAVAGAMAFVPLFLQIVIGMSPAQSGLMMTPMIAGLMVGLTAGGRVIGRIGKYRMLAVTGTAAATLAMVALCTLAWIDIGSTPIAVALGALGFSLGVVMPGMTVALQNAVEPRQLGVATATASFIRSLGNAFGVGIAGAIITYFALGVGGTHDQMAGAVSDILDHGLAALSGESGTERTAIMHSYRAGVTTTFAASAFLCGLAFCIVLFLKDKPLRAKNDPGSTAKLA